MFCNKCGKSNDTNNNYCENCGYKLSSIKTDTAAKSAHMQATSAPSTKKSGIFERKQYKIGAIVIIALIIVVIYLSVGNGKKEPEELLEGTWACPEEIVEEAEEAYPGYEMTFYDDNTFTIPDDDGDVWISGDYSLSDDTLRFTTRYANGIRSTNEFIYTYSIDSDDLTLSTNGESVTYNRW